MKRQILSITVIDTRKPEDHPGRQRTKTFTNHTDFLREMGRLQREMQARGLDVSERTETTLTVFAPAQAALPL